MELRAHYVKYLHRRRRLTLEHWEGVSNPADGLTKSCKLVEMWLNLKDAVGLVPGLEDDRAAFLRGLSQSTDDDATELLSGLSVREGEVAHRVHFLRFLHLFASVGDQLLSEDRDIAPGERGIAPNEI